jgi:DNA-binding PadR family transcriptional regulator
MGRFGLGEFEQAVLLSIIRLRSNAYGVPIRQELTERIGREVSFGAVYTALERLEAKGFVSSRMGDPTPERGGRAKRFYRIEAPGERALEEARKKITGVWGSLPSGARA